MRGQFARFAGAVATLLALLSAAEASAFALLEAAVAPVSGATGSASWGDNADPINMFTLDYPRDGEVLPPSFDVICAVRVDSEAGFNSKYRDATLCVELNGVIALCVPLMQSNPRLESVDVGTHRQSLHRGQHDQTQADSGRLVLRRWL